MSCRGMKEEGEEIIGSVKPNYCGSPLMQTRTSAFFNSFCISSVRAWNSLPSDIVLCNSISAFKNALKVYYCF